MRRIFKKLFLLIYLLLLCDCCGQMLRADVLIGQNVAEKIRSDLDVHGEDIVDGILISKIVE